jgi:hypothetical protein
MSEENASTRLPPPVVAMLGWLVPGAGYILIGQKMRGMVAGGAIIATYMLGLLVAGARVIDVPGYDQNGNEVRLLGGRLVRPDQPHDYAVGEWALTHGGFLSELTNKPWFAAQVLAGPLSLGSAVVSVNLAQKGPGFGRPHAPLETVGTLYTAIAGMLNLMIIIDSAYRAGLPPEGE